MLDNKIQQFIRVYTESLVHEFKTTLKNLQEFIKKANEGISKDPSKVSEEEL